MNGTYASGAREQQPEPKRETVPERIERLSQLVNALHDDQQNLYARLQPVARPGGPMEIKGAAQTSTLAAVASQSPTADAIEYLIDRVAHMRNELVDVTSRLEL
jgi:hypothetical protein